MFDDDVWRYLPIGPRPTLVMAALGAGLAFYVALVRSRSTRAITGAMLAASILIVLVCTTRPFSNGGGGFNWQLGKSIESELHNINRSLGLVNVVGNVALFVPIGWLVAVLAGRRPVVVGTFCALLLSTAVEVGQMLSGWYGDVDDVVLNGLGGLLGAVLATVLGMLGRRSPLVSSRGTSRRCSRGTDSRRGSPRGTAGSCRDRGQPV